MLQTLSIRDFVIVDSMELEFGRGFSAMTGETGAGKSILIDALELALGARSDANIIREGASRAEISAEFVLNEAAKTWLNEHEIDVEEDVVFFRRMIDASGRSRGFINGVQVTTAQMRELGENFVNIHGQHAHQSLLRSEGQRLLLDKHAGLQAELKKVEESYRIWQDQLKALNNAKTNVKELNDKKEYLSWQVEELEKIHPLPGEWESVSDSYNRLANAASLIEGVQEALTETSESDISVLSRINAMHHRLMRLSEMDRALESVAELYDLARIQLQEAVYILNDYLGRTDWDPDNLRRVETRMNALYSAARKYHIEPEDLPDELEKLRIRLQALSDSQDLMMLQKRTDEAKDAYMAAAKELSQKRRVTAQGLGKAVSDIMDDLGMEGGRFSVTFNPIEPGLSGLEQVEFLVAGHKGASLRPLAKVASGGELARIALAISVITSTATDATTLIFDEVDSGIGGGVAEVVGRLLKRLGKDRQVLCVTHLPQVASQAETHFQVSKTASDDVSYPISRIVKLSEKERIEEIARMLGGIEITSTTRQHAREMLSE